MIGAVRRLEYQQTDNARLTKRIQVLNNQIAKLELKNKWEKNTVTPKMM
jgi:hypothetical protein